MADRDTTDAIERAETASGVTRRRQKNVSVPSRTIEESVSFSRLAGDPGQTLEEYYTLNVEEKEALLSSNVRKIGTCIDKLDGRLKNGCSP